MGIAVCNVPGYGVEEVCKILVNDANKRQTYSVLSLKPNCNFKVADTTLCLILNLYRRTYWLANMVSVIIIRDQNPHKLTSYFVFTIFTLDILFPMCRWRRGRRSQARNNWKMRPLVAQGFVETLLELLVLVRSIDRSVGVLCSLQSFLVLVPLQNQILEWSW